MLPPTPEHLLPVMDGLLDLANQRDTGIPPLVLGSLVSFGFVFAHPFMDGNGRLSRFLFHKIACRDALLPNGLVLPISMAMARHEDRYLQALCSFSALAREAWTVAKVSDMEFDCSFEGAPEIYHYWDASSCVQFGLEMAQEALQHDLHEEVQFLHRFDRVYARLNREIDMNNNLMNLLSRLLVQNQGVLSASKRKMFVGKGCLPQVLDEAQRIAQEALNGADGDEGAGQ
ncbi:Fic family protein [Pantoea sp. 18069]|uniref:Fic family protein n=1 Tax=Pantoea sp. 18069 TaxID=2681415 RepID=UPI00190F7F85|nr:Fic family protein [Pantoea sp. 18069]